MHGKEDGRMYSFKYNRAHPQKYRMIDGTMMNILLLHLCHQLCSILMFITENRFKREGWKRYSLKVSSGHPYCNRLIFTTQHSGRNGTILRWEFLFWRKVDHNSTKHMAILEQTQSVFMLRCNQNCAFSRITPTLMSQIIAKSCAKLNNLLTMRCVMSQSTSIQMSLCGLILLRNSYKIYC